MTSGPCQKGQTEVDTMGTRVLVNGQTLIVCCAKCHFSLQGLIRRPCFFLASSRTLRGGPGQIVPMEKSTIAEPSRAERCQRAKVTNGQRIDPQTLNEFPTLCDARPFGVDTRIAADDHKTCQWIYWTYATAVRIP